jgi:simple sugar transport system substrate-binding protein
MEKVMKKLIVLVLLICISMTVFATGRSDSGANSGKYVFTGISKINVPWFASYEKKLLQFGQEFGVTTYYQAPSSADEALQVRTIEDAINQGANAVLVVPNDANSLVPVFQRAKQRNVVVITHESPDQPNADFDVEMIDNVTYGAKFVEEIVKVIGPTGEYAIFVGSLTVPAHNIWADGSEKYAAEKYPGLKLVASRFPVGEDRNLARQKTLELIQTYPNLKGIICYGSEGAPGAGQAIRERGLQNKIAVAGTTTPNAIREFIKDGSVSAAIIWDSGDASYAMAYLAKLVLDGKRADIKQGMTIPGIGQPKFEGINLIFDKPLVLTTGNVDNYDF